MLSQALPIAYNRPGELDAALREFLGDGNYRIVEVSTPPLTLWWLASGLTSGQFFSDQWHVEVAWALTWVSGRPYFFLMWRERQTDVLNTNDDSKSQGQIVEIKSRMQRRHGD